MNIYILIVKLGTPSLPKNVCVFNDIETVKKELKNKLWEVLQIEYPNQPYENFVKDIDKMYDSLLTDGETSEPWWPDNEYFLEKHEVIEK